MKKTIIYTYEELASSSELSAEDQELFSRASAAVKEAQAQFSHFQVGTAARLMDGSIVTSSNFENTSMLHCAEQNLLLHLHSMYPAFTIKSIAVTYKNMNDGTDSTMPITPCGKCRQLLLEAEISVGSPMRVIMGSDNGKIWVADGVQSMLPLAYSGYI